MYADRSVKLALSFLFLCLPAGAAAEWRCDCTKITGACEAKVAVEDRWVEVSTNTKGCARVDYFIDGQPMVTMVTDGKQRQDWLTANDNARVLVQSCQTCADRVAAGGSAESAGTGRRADTSESPKRDETTLTPQIRVAPLYPPAAERDQVRGHVVLRFDVTPGGTVANPRVIEASPRGVFERAAIDAIRRWRYPTGESQRTLTERLEFAPPASRPAATRRVGLDGRVERRNWCVKRGLVYDLIEMVEVQLFNACDAPVVAYTCAGGLGANTGRWVCSPRGDDVVALVRQGDSLDGWADEVDLPDRDLRYAYATEQFVARPPNTQYYWIACALDDADCHRVASRWVGHMHRKPRSMDPRRASEVPIGGSF